METGSDHTQERSGSAEHEPRSSQSEEAGSSTTQRQGKDSPATTQPSEAWQNEWPPPTGPGGDDPKSPSVVRWQDTDDTLRKESKPVASAEQPTTEDRQSGSNSGSDRSVLTKEDSRCWACRNGLSHAWHDNGAWNFGNGIDVVAAQPPKLDKDPYADVPTPREIAEKAIELVYADRQADYGHPADDYGRTAALWSALLGVTITPKEAALCMVLVKLSREMNAPKPDNMVDAHGYLLVAGRIKERELGRE